MTFGYKKDENVLYENHPDFVSYDDDGRLILDVDEMPPRKLGNIKRAVESAIEANE